MIPQHVIDEVLLHSNIVEVIGEYVKLKRKGSEHVGLCPFHDEKSGSFSVNPQKRMYKCFGCGKGGNVITFLLESRKMPFPDIIKSLADRYGITYSEAAKKEYKKPVWKNKTHLSDKLVRWFETDRALTQETLTHFQISEGMEWMPQLEKEVNTVQFPYFDGEEVVNVKFRDGKKKFKLSAGAKLIPYNLNAIKGAKRCVWVEGEIDCMSFHQAGIREVVSVPNGAGSGKINLEYIDNTIEHFLSIEEFIIAVDDDAPGRALREALANRFGKEKCKYMTFHGHKDGNKLLKEEGIQGIIEAFSERKDFPLEGVFTVRDYSQEIDDIYQYGLPKGAKTQMKNLNELVEFHKGYMTVITGIPSHGKALSIDTDIPTPFGWKKMKDISIGDIVYNEKGEWITVLNVSNIMYNRPCYELVFNDGTKIIADEQHLWLTDDWKSRRSAANRRKNDKKIKKKNNGTDQTNKRSFPAIRTTLEISQTVLAKNDNRRNHSIPLITSIKNPHIDLPISPYVLGAWLGDGGSSDGGFTTADLEIVENIKSYGYKVTKYSNKYGYGIHKLAAKLNSIGVLNNKHIPMFYLRASESQRLELLQGLMDTDGYCDKLCNICEFCNTNKQLAFDFFELATSLGIRAVIKESDAKLYGRIVSKKYRVTFTTKKNIFKLTRKLKLLPKHRKAERSDRYIISCNKVDSVPVKCISVSGNSKLYLCTKSYIATHNSQFLDQVVLDLSLTSDWKCGMYSPENRPTSWHITKMARKLIGKPWWGEGRITRDEIELSKEYLNNKMFFVKPKKDFTLDTILEHWRQLIERHGIDCGVIDAWNKLNHKYKSDETKYVDEALEKVTNFCEMMNFHAFIVAHPTKVPRQKNSNKFEVPSLYSISGSSNWYNKADIGITIYRDFEEDVSSALVQKVRADHWGHTGSCQFKFDKGSGRFNPYLGGTPTFNNTPWIHSGIKEPENLGIILDDGSPNPLD